MCLIISGGTGMYAQTLQIGTVLPMATNLPPDQLHFSSYTTAQPATQPFSIASFPLIQPAFFQENPRGYSYLCRLELEIEEKLPVGIWVKTSDPTEIPNGLNTNAHVRLRLFHF